MANDLTIIHLGLSPKAARVLDALIDDPDYEPADKDQLILEDILKHIREQMPKGTAATRKKKPIRKKAK